MHFVRATAILAASDEGIEIRSQLTKVDDTTAP
jgi:hypothetical protein